MNDDRKALREAAARARRRCRRTLRERLPARADEEGLLDVAYASVDSPLGPLLVAVDAGRAGDARVRGVPPDDELLEELARDAVAAPARGARPARRGAPRAGRVLRGPARAFELPLDWSLTHGFTRRVLEQTARIGSASWRPTRTSPPAPGSARAVRAAGNALGSNPMPIVVPCHRVVRTGGTLGGYTGGVERKEFLLRLEGVLV